MNCEIIYQNIKNGSVLLEELKENEISALFSYLCSLIEQGAEAETDIMDFCASREDISDLPSAEAVMEKVYEKRIFKKAHRLASLKRLAVACVAVCVCAVLFVGTASAFGVNIVEELYCVITDDYVVKFEERNELLNSAVTNNYTYERIFEKRLAGLIYPGAFPPDVTPTRVVSDKEKDGRLYTLFLQPSEGENWQIFAKPESESYLPMGYKFSVDYGSAVLDFVYTVSRSGEGITGYKLYTVHNGVQYTFVIKDKDWKNVKIILENLVVK